MAIKYFHKDGILQKVINVKEESLQVYVDAGFEELTQEEYDSAVAARFESEGV